MRILFHRRSTAGQRTGIGYYASRLLDACAKIPGEHQVDGFPDGCVWAACRTHAAVAPILNRWKLKAKRRPVSRLLSPLTASFRRVAHTCRSLAAGALERQLRDRLARGDYDLYHEPNILPLPIDLPTVLTLHDLTVLLHPEWHPEDRVRLYDRHFLSGVRRARHFITVSETVRQQAIRFLNLPPARVSAIHNGTHPDLKPMSETQATSRLARLGLRPSYLLHVGTIEPRKNLLLLMRAYCSLPRVLREQCPLVLAGGWGWRFEAVHSYYHTHARHHGVRVLGYVPERSLAALYSGARALVCPSLDEGFGLPAVEMLACGGAVLASDIPVFRETVGEQALLIAAEDSDAWRRKMTEVILDDDLRHLLRLGAVQASRKYRWEECAARTLEVYRTASAGTSSVPVRRAA